MDGIYEYSDKTINERPIWISHCKSWAIWYSSKQGEWAIGPVKDILDGKAGIISFGGQGHNSPFDVPNDKWMYNVNGEWKKTKKVNDISVECMDDIGK